MAFMPYIFATAAPAVGSIPAEFNVSPTGAATYEIPIECPTGVGGLKPELKFVYSSQLGDSAEYVTELLLSFAKCSDVIN